ncbi:MAG: S1 RNA-binding domain-containing protein [Mycoplasmataceae bacterium]|jgi:predicted RNA-binding protein with RPS1 domain|nr:S1 RNA-binding domain-containing protein [Mycoplasmataceae bacterium]
MIDFKNIIKCKVVRIEPTFAILSFNESQGICHISEISDYHISNIHNFFKVGETYDFLLLNGNEQTNKYKLSYKQIRPKLLKYHREIIPSLSGYKNLYETTMSKLK